MACRVVKIENMNMSIPQVAGDFVRTFRLEHGLTMDQVASEARRYGMNWNSSSIKKLEEGKMSPTLPNLIVLTQALNQAGQESLSLKDIFIDFEKSTEVSITDEFSISIGELVDILDGIEIDLDKGPTITLADLPKATQQQIIESQLERATEKNISNSRQRKELSDTLYMLASMLDGAAVTSHQPTLAEERASNKLKIEPRAVAAICQLSYDHFLDEEASYRAGSQATPQKRGRETREILKELTLLIQYIIKTGDMPSSWTSYEEDGSRLIETKDLIEELLEDDETK